MSINEMIERLEESMQSIKDICTSPAMDDECLYKINEELENIQTVIWALKENT